MTNNMEPTSGTAGHRKGEHRKGRGLHRRTFLGGMAGAGLAAVAVAGTAFSLLTDAKGNKAGAATNTATLNIPDLLEGTTSDGTTTFTLTARTGTHEVLSGVSSDTMATTGRTSAPP